VRSAITQHADHIYKDLPTNIHRLAARRLFKAISERDYRGRIIRRATRLGEIIDIVTQDNKQTASAESSRILVEVIEAFREPQCWLPDASGRTAARRRLRLSTFPMKVCCADGRS
jgi:hypothetical protein